MWRKQDEPKAPSPSQEVKAPPRVEPVAPPPAMAPPRETVPPAPAGHLTSALTIKGEITGRDDLFIDGEVQGTITLQDGRLTIGPNGRVHADIDAREIIVRGAVKGSLRGRERVQIGQTGRAEGDIRTRRISIEEGAELHGRVDITRDEELRQHKPVVAESAVDQVRHVPASQQSPETVVAT